MFQISNQALVIAFIITVAVIIYAEIKMSDTKARITTHITSILWSGVVVLWISGTIINIKTPREHGIFIKQ